MIPALNAFSKFQCLVFLAKKGDSLYHIPHSSMLYNVSLPIVTSFMLRVFSIEECCKDPNRLFGTG